MLFYQKDSNHFGHNYFCNKNDIKIELLSFAYISKLFGVFLYQFCVN